MQNMSKLGEDSKQVKSIKFLNYLRSNVNSRLPENERNIWNERIEIFKNDINTIQVKW